MKANDFSDLFISTVQNQTLLLCKNARHICHVPHISSTSAGAEFSPGALAEVGVWPVRLIGNAIMVWRTREGWVSNEDSLADVYTFCCREFAIVQRFVMFHVGWLGCCLKVTPLSLRCWAEGYAIVEHFVTRCLIKPSRGFVWLNYLGITNVTTIFVERFQILFSALAVDISGKGRSCFLVSCKESAFWRNRTPFRSCLSPPPSSVWFCVEASDFERVLTMVHLLGLWTLSVVWFCKKNRVSETSALRPKGTWERGTTHLYLKLFSVTGWLARQIHISSLLESKKLQGTLVQALR